MRIPIFERSQRVCGGKVDEELYKVLEGVPGQSLAADRLGALIELGPHQYGSELTTSCAMARMISEVFEVLNTFSNIKLPHEVLLNRNEKAGGSISSAVPGTGRPDLLLLVRDTNIYL